MRTGVRKRSEKIRHIDLLFLLLVAAFLFAAGGVVIKSILGDPLVQTTIDYARSTARSRSIGKLRTLGIVNVILQASWLVGCLPGVNDLARI